MPLMGSIYVGNSALQTSQNALNTTAHNMSNSDTTGYVRQQVLLGTSTYNTLSINAAGVAKQQVGLGVTYSATRQVRDYFLDQTYRRESGRSAFYEVSSSAISEVENILGELDGVAFKGSLDDLWTSVQELAKSPESSVVQGLFVQRASNFISRAQSVYQGLSDYQDNLNLQVIQMVDKINTYGNQIKVLNDQIKKIECGGVEYANDLRDARNQIIDELSAMGNIKVTEEYDGALSISFEGTPFVSNDVVYEMNTHIDATTGFVTPFWTQNASFTYNEDGTRNYNISNAKVFNTNQTISTDLNTDIGQLKALVLARGDRRGTYEDLEDKDYYNENIAQSVIVNIQGEFDRLINSVVESINKVLEEASDNTPGGYLSNEDGSALQLFVKKNGEDYKFTIMNISVNQDLIEQPT